MKVIAWICLFLLSIAIGLFIVILHFPLGLFFMLCVTAPLCRKMSRAIDEEKSRKMDEEFALHEKRRKEERQKEAEEEKRKDEERVKRMKRLLAGKQSRP